MGHLAPAMAVADALRKQIDVDAFFICGTREQEKKALAPSGYRFSALSAPKFPRGISLGWIVFPFHFLFSLLAGFIILLRTKPTLIFSKGGFVSVPVCVAASVLNIPIVLHESDAVQGLGNRLIARLASRVCHGFPIENETEQDVYTGNPVRSFLKEQTASEGLMLTGFSGRRPIVMITGGSQGAEALNRAVDSFLDALLNQADVIHLTGPGKQGARKQHARYFVREFVDRELGSLYAIASLVVTRAGAGTLSELSYFEKPSIIVPIKGLANDHQVRNAALLEQRGAAIVLKQSELDHLSDRITTVLADEHRLKTLGTQLGLFFPKDADQKIAAVLLDALKNRR